MDTLLLWIETIIGWIVGGGMLLFMLMIWVMIFFKAFDNDDCV